jgi:membrane associated rhomboid family serine protease
MDSTPRNSATGLPYRAPFTLFVFAVSLVLSLLEFGGSPLEGYLLDAESITLEGILVSPLIHVNAYHMTGTLLSLLLLGGILETRWGTLRFLLLYLLSVWGAAGITAVSFLALGATGWSCGSAAAALASLVAVGMLYPEHRLVWSLPPLKYLVWSLLFLGAAGLVLVDLRSVSRTFLLPQVSGVAFGMAFVSLQPSLMRMTARWKVRRLERERERQADIRKRVDLLLEKISTGGMESLTQGERRFLRQASKHYKES